MDHRSEYKEYLRLLSVFFDDLGPVEKMFARFVSVSEKNILTLNPRIQNLRKKCGNMNAVREFLIYLVFETYYIENNELAYYLPLLGEFDDLENSGVYRRMNTSGKKYIMSLMRKQFMRVDNFANFIFSNITPQNKKDIRVLDIGCGIGQLSYALAKRGMTVTAVDLDVSESLKIQSLIRDRFPYSRNVTFLNGNAFDLNFLPDKGFELLTLSDVVEHIRDKEGLFTEINRKLVEFGMIAVHTDNLILQQIVRIVKKFFLVLTLRSPKEYEFAWSGAEGGHTGLCNPKSISEILSKMDYECIVKYDTHNFLSKVFPYFFAPAYCLLAKKMKW